MVIFLSYHFFLFIKQFRRHPMSSVSQQIHPFINSPYLLVLCKVTGAQSIFQKPQTGNRPRWGYGKFGDLVHLGIFLDGGACKLHIRYFQTALCSSECSPFIC